MEHGLQYLNPESRLRDRQQYAADVQERIQSAMEQKIKIKTQTVPLSGKVSRSFSSSEAESGLLLRF